MDDNNFHNDEQLQLRISQGDEQAFEQFVNRFSDKVFFHAMTFVKTWHEAEEMAHDIFLHIWQKKEKLANVENLENYIFVVSKNFLLSYMRKKIRRFNSDELSGESLIIESSAVKYENKELGMLLEKAITHLSDQKQQVFRMIHQEGLSQEVVAQKLGIATRSVRWNLVSATNGIRNYLHKYASGDLFYLICASTFF